VAPGRYVVNFGQNVQAINGWSRWVQPDTLQIGIVGTPTNPGAWCTTADSAADSNAVWVNCQHSCGPGSQGQSAFFDTSFFLFAVTLVLFAASREAKRRAAASIAMPKLASGAALSALALLLMTA